MLEPKVSRIFLGLLVALACGLLLGLCYAALAQSFLYGWMMILGLHSIIGLIVLTYLPLSMRLKPLMSRVKSLQAAGLLLLAAILVSLLSRQLQAQSYATPSPLGMKTLVMITWVPWAEELVFRGGIGQIFESWLGRWWGRYGSALIFALAHGGGVFSGYGLPIVAIGPFLLAWCCSLSYAHTGRLSAPIALHAVCNASAIIFSYFDPRWLEWLDFLYLKV